MGALGDGLALPLAEAAFRMYLAAFAWAGVCHNCSSRYSYRCGAKFVERALQNLTKYMPIFWPTAQRPYKAKHGYAEQLLLAVVELQAS